MCSCWVRWCGSGSGAVQLTGEVRFCAGRVTSGRKKRRIRPRQQEYQISAAAVSPQMGRISPALRGAKAECTGGSGLILKKKYKSFIKKT